MAKENNSKVKGWLKSNLLRLLRNIAVATLFAMATRGGARLYVRRLWPTLESFLHVWWLTALGTIAILLIGTALFFFKKHAPIYYGLGEIGFAATVAWTSIMRAQTTDATSWVPIAGAAYLVVRGWTNYDEGRKPKQAEDKATTGEAPSNAPAS